MTRIFASIAGLKNKNIDAYIPLEEMIESAEKPFRKDPMGVAEEMRLEDE